MASPAPPKESTAPPLDSGSSDGDALPELPLFGCREAYVYRVPPATTVGHRAEMWDVNNWLATVSLRVVQADDDCYVRLLDDKTGELFAECPIPTDHRPLTTAVEPVIDSSRYFVLRIVDRDSQRHAFIGIGFRERSEASDFNAALHEFLQYIKRKRAAEAMRHAYEERLAAEGHDATGAAEGGASPATLPDLSIKEGEVLRLRIAAPKPPGAGFVSRAAARGVLGKTFSLIMDGHGGSVAALSPPPRPGSSPRSAMCVSPCLESGGGSPMHADAGSAGASPGGAASRLGRVSGSGDAELQQRLAGLHLQQQAGEASGPPSCSASVASTSTVAAAAADLADDDFGDFEAASPQQQQQQQQRQEQQEAEKAQQGVAG